MGTLYESIKNFFSLSTGYACLNATVDCKDTFTTNTLLFPRLKLIQSFILNINDRKIWSK